MSLASLSKGERFKELTGLIVKKVFDPRQGEATNGQPGKLRQGLILTDGTAEMGFTLWGTDVGQVMKGDLLTLKNGWVNAYDSRQGEKFDLRLRKPPEGERGWAKTGSGADIPQAPPPQAPKPSPQYVPVDRPAEAFGDMPMPSPAAQVVLNEVGAREANINKPSPQYVPVDRPAEAFGDMPMPSPAAQVVLNEVGAREANINKQSARRDAVTLLCGTHPATGDKKDFSITEVLEVSRSLYRWAMNLGPHWMVDEATRKRFWAKLGEAGLDSKDAHRELRVYSMYDFEGTEADALGIILGSAMPLEAPRTPAGAEDGMGPVGPTAQKPTAATGDAPDANNVFPVDTISTWGEFWGAVFNNLGLNKTQALDIAEVNDQVELSGTDYQAKYMTVARAIDLRRASDRAAAERAAAG